MKEKYAKYIAFLGNRVYSVLFYLVALHGDEYKCLPDIMQNTLHSLATECTWYSVLFYLVALHGDE